MKYNHYHIRNIKPKNRQNDWAISILIDAREWPPRNRKHRGCTEFNFVGSREMPPDEAQEWEGAYRLAFVRYYDWQTFINDELKYLPADHPFMQKVYQWKERYKNIPEKPVQQLALNIGEETDG